jgi:NDP-sugar pyrophosphorylase family protein
MKHTQIPYGVVEIAEGGAFKAIQEKPEFNNLVNTGVYILEPKVLELVPKGQYFDMTSLLEKAFEKGHRIVVYPISDKDWIDIGQLEEYQNLLRKTGVL